MSLGIKLRLDVRISSGSTALYCLPEFMQNLELHGRCKMLPGREGDTRLKIRYWPSPGKSRYLITTLFS